MSQDLVEEKIEEEKIEETVIVEEVVKVNEQVADEEEVVIDKQEEPKPEETKKVVIDTQVVEETPKFQVSASASVSGQAIIDSINKEDYKSDSKHSKGWIWAAVVLFLGIIGLLVYQNLDFFAPTEDTVSHMYWFVKIKPKINTSNSAAKNERIVPRAKENKLR